MSPLRSELHWLRGTLRVILFISLCGIAFSGTLTYREVFGAAASCPSPGAAGTILGYPACVYGLAMYAVLAGVAAAGLLRRWPPHQLVRTLEHDGVS